MAEKDVFKLKWHYLLWNFTRILGNIFHNAGFSGIKDAGKPEIL